ncbi:MAG: hypothetical protein ABI877_00030 [Gemmatimonadaceae bacterium]
MSQNHGTDKQAALTGLVVTAVLLFIMCFTIVKLTNAKYANKEGAHAEATK